MTYRYVTYLANNIKAMGRNKVILGFIIPDDKSIHRTNEEPEMANKR